MGDGWTVSEGSIGVMKSPLSLHQIYLPPVCVGSVPSLKWTSANQCDNIHMLARNPLGPINATVEY